MVSSLRRSRARARRRGAALFIVVLVITLLTGIGLFAARSSSLATSAAGFGRQMTQTHYVTDFAMQTVIQELSTGNASAHLSHATLTPDTGCTSLNNGYVVNNATCVRFTMGSLQLLQNPLPGTFFQQTLGATPGSFGVGDIDADFLVELTDVGPAAPPVAGSDLSTPNALAPQFWTVTLTATSVVRPRFVGAITQEAQNSSSVETQRAHVVVGPLRFK